MSRTVWRTENQWLADFREKRAFYNSWRSGRSPHVLLTKKTDERDHSDGFFNWSIIAQYPSTEKAVTRHLAIMLPLENPSAFDVQGITYRCVGPGLVPLHLENAC